MEDKSTQLSRRDAIKLLGAALGAAALANLPGKWSTPELASGVLPAHAQTSNPPPLPLYTLAAGADDPQANFCQNLTSTVVITPKAQNVSLRYTITSNPAGLTFSTPALLTNTVSTNALGEASVVIRANSAFNVDDQVIVTWSFVNASDGTNTDDQVFTNTSGGC